MQCLRSWMSPRRSFVHTCHGSRLLSRPALRVGPVSCNVSGRHTPARRLVTQSKPCCRLVCNPIAILTVPGLTVVTAWVRWCLTPYSGGLSAGTPEQSRPPPAHGVDSWSLPDNRFSDLDAHIHFEDPHVGPAVQNAHARARRAVQA